MKSSTVSLPLYGMRKVIASFAVVIYFTFACGVMINYHFCMDRYTSFSLYQSATNSCFTCGMQAKKHGCCHDEVKIVKLQNDYQNAASGFSLKNIHAPSTPSLSSYSCQPLTAAYLPNSADHSPPLLLPATGIYLQNCVFRI